MRFGLTCLALVAVLGSAAYANSFENGFHFDDGHSIEDNVWLRSFAHAPRWFTDVSTFSPLARNRSYRPVLLATFALSHQIAGGRPVGYHVVTLLFHGLGALLVGLLFRRFGIAAGVPERRAETIALFCTALFAVHPILTEAVNYISARSSLLAAVSMFGALHAYVVAREDKKPRWLVWSFVWLVLALFVKLIAVTTPLLCVAWELLLGPARTRLLQDNLRSWLVRLAPPFGLVAGFTLFHEWIVGDAARAARSSIEPWHFFLTETRVWGRFVDLFVYPADLCADLTMRWSTSPFEADTFRAILAAASVIGAALLLYRRAPLFSFGVAWFFISLLPTNTFMPLSEPASEHRIYVALPALLLAVYELARRIELGPRLARVAPALAVLPLLAAIAGTRQRNGVWASEETLWADAIQCAPDNGRAHLNYGRALFGKGDLAGTRREYEACRSLWPYYAYCQINLTALALHENRLADAELDVRDAERLEPDNVYTSVWRGEVELRAQRPQTAELAFTRALAIAPGLIQAEEGLALAVFEQGRLEEARAAFERLPPPRSAEGWYARGYLKDLAGELEPALELYRTAVGVEAGHTRARYNMAVALQRLGRRQDAIVEYERLIGGGGRSADALYNLTLALYQEGRLDAARTRRDELRAVDPAYPRLAELTF